MIDRFGEGILNHSYYKWKIFSMAVLTSNCEKFIVKFGTDVPNRYVADSASESDGIRHIF